VGKQSIRPQCCYFWLAFVLTILGVCPADFAQEAGYTRASSIAPVLAVLAKDKLSGSLEVSGRCRPGLTPELPRFAAEVGDNSSTLEVLRRLFAGIPDMRVSQDRDLRVRMVQENVPRDVLDIKIKHLEFVGYGRVDPWAVWSGQDAVFAVLQAPEVVSFMTEHGFKRPFYARPVQGNPGHWPPEEPHISGTLDNVTVSQALDHVLKVFPGVWTYVNCPGDEFGDRDVYFAFFSEQQQRSR